MLKQVKKILLSSALLAAVSFNAQAVDNQCMPIGGTALAEAIDETHLVATMSGAFASANAKIVDQKKTETGLILGLEHVFLSQKGGVLRTKDTAVLTAVPGRDQVYLIEFTYNVVESRGEFAGYKGKFNSFGTIKLGEGKVVVRYSGELCK